MNEKLVFCSIQYRCKEEEKRITCKTYIQKENTKKKIFFHR